MIVNGEFNARVDIPCRVNKNAIRIWLDSRRAVRVARMIQIAGGVATFRCVNLAFGFRAKLDGVTGILAWTELTTILKYQFVLDVSFFSKDPKTMDLRRANQPREFRR